MESLNSLEYLERLYAAYLEDPHSLSDDWRAFFSNLGDAGEAHLGGPRAPADSLSSLAAKQASVLELVNAYRIHGHRQAHLDPLRYVERPPVLQLDPEYHGLGEADMEMTFHSGMQVEPQEARLREIVRICANTYCGPIGAEFMYLTSTTQKQWIKRRLESARGMPNFPAEKRRDILWRLTAAKGLELYLHKTYPGQIRFSLEGAESLIPLLDDLIQSAGSVGVEEIAIGMTHRGRLNVLVNILGKQPRELFAEFEGSVDPGMLSGDLRHNQGFSSDVLSPGGPVHLVVAFNPAHLEIVHPVVEGAVRTRQEQLEDLERNQVLPVQIHGDAAFAGQGVVMETLNLSATRGYGTGGTVHIIVNNQLGFTTSDPLDSRSSLYCTDVAKMVQAPIFHVNGHDPEAVVFVTRLALDFRLEFRKDVVVDMVCYRRFGHDEADQPMATQPWMYKKIRQEKSVRQLYAEKLVAKDVVEEGEPKRMAKDYRKALRENRVVSRPRDLPKHRSHYFVDWRPYLGRRWTEPADTRVSRGEVKQLGAKLTEYPDTFRLHRAVTRTMEARREMTDGDRPMDWGFAENLAYATLLADGFTVRLSGQDSERGTFFHRHAVLHDQKTGVTYKPLDYLYPGQPRFRVINSLLSEEAVLAFEYGYSTANPHCLVIWEAQFGDFANGAQVVIDQFLSSSEAKWGRLSGLVMMLPHGYDGQGPEHSSARPERFLQLCAEENMQVCVPSTPAQVFHLLRRQMVRPYRKPLVIMSPKSLLRHPSSTSSLEDLTDRGFHTVIDEIESLDPKGVIRVVLCTGKVYFDLLQHRRKYQLQHVAIVRVEQLYPFPKADVAAVLARYPKAGEIVWAQEEPRNQGAWYFMRDPERLAGCVGKEQSLLFAGRAYTASPATGYLSLHLSEQSDLVADALALDELESRRAAS